MEVTIILICFHLYNMHALHTLIRKFMMHVHLRRQRLETVSAALEYAITLLLKLNLNCSFLH